MEEKEKSHLQLLRDEIAASCPNLANYKILEMCEDYGIQYNVPDTNSLRLFMLLASAERKLMNSKDH